MSGELLRVRIDFGRSIVTVVRRFGTPSRASTWSSHSPSTTRSFRLKRVGVGLRVAPRPLLDSTGISFSYARHENITRTLGMLTLFIAPVARRRGIALSYAAVAAHAHRKGRPLVLRHGLQCRRVLVIETLIDPHVPHHRRHVVTRFPIRQRLDP